MIWTRFAIPRTKRIRGAHSRNEFDYPAWHESVDPSFLHLSRRETHNTSSPSFHFAFHITGVRIPRRFSAPSFQASLLCTARNSANDLTPLPFLPGAISLPWRPSRLVSEIARARNSSRVSWALWSRGNSHCNKFLDTRANTVGLYLSERIIYQGKVLLKKVRGSGE